MELKIKSFVSSLIKQALLMFSKYVKMLNIYNCRTNLHLVNFTYCDKLCPEKFIYSTPLANIIHISRYISI